MSQESGFWAGRCSPRCSTQGVLLQNTGMKVRVSGAVCCSSRCSQQCVLLPIAGMKVRVCASELAAGAASDALEACRGAVLHLHYNGTHMCAAGFQVFIWIRVLDISNPKTHQAHLLST